MPTSEEKVTNSNPVVNVIIRAFNAQAYIGAAVDSVYSQDYPGNIQVLILFDEGTSDNTLEKLNQFFSKQISNRTIGIIKHPHMSPFRSLFYGLKISQSDFTTFLDYDNLYSTDYIRKMIDYFSEGNSDFAFSSPVLIDTSGRRTGGRLYEISKNIRRLRLRQMYSNSIDINTIFINRKASKLICKRFERLPFPTYDWIYEDWVIAVIGLFELNVGVMYGDYVFYRTHPQNITYNMHTVHLSSPDLHRKIISLIAIRNVEGMQLSTLHLMILAIYSVYKVTISWFL